MLLIGVLARSGKLVAHSDSSENGSYENYFAWSQRSSAELHSLLHWLAADFDTMSSDGSRHEPFSRLCVVCAANQWAQGRLMFKTAAFNMRRTASKAPQLLTSSISCLRSDGVCC